MRQVILYPGEDDYWIAECPSLPGCISQGKTKEETINNMKEAIHGYVNALKEDGLPVPAERFEAFYRCACYGAAAGLCGNGVWMSFLLINSSYSLR